MRTWMESMSTENTRAPSLARRAASGRPTTSDLRVRSRQILCTSNKKQEDKYVPVDDSDSLPVCTVAVRQERVVHPDVFQAFDNRKGCAREDGLDEARWGLVVYCRRRIAGGG